MVGAQAIIADIVPPRERGQYMGLIGSVFAVASVAGPLLGGFLVDSLSWRWIFYVNLPVGAVAVVIVARGCTCPRPTCATRSTASARRSSTGGVTALILLTTWGGNQYAWGSATIVGLGDRRRRARSRSSSGRSAAPPSRSCRCELFRSRVFNVASAMGFTDRHGDVRRDHLHPALPAGRLRREPDELRAADAAADGRPARRGDRLRAERSAGWAATASSRSPARRSSSSGCSCSRGSASGRRTGSRRSTWRSSASGIGLVMQVLVLVVQNDADPAGHRRRDLDRDVLPLARRLVRRRDLRRDLRVAAADAARHAAAARRPRARQGARAPSRRSTSRRRAARLPAGVRARAPRRLPLGDASLAIVPFALSWFLKEVPLRTTLHRSNLGAEEAAAGGTGSEALAAEPLV